MKTSAIVVAAGQGTRIGAAGGKAFIAIGGQPMATYSLRTLSALSDLLSIVFVVGAGQDERAASTLSQYGPWPVPIHLARGGAERQDSVAAGLAAVDATAELVIVHDAARPFVPLSCFEACAAAAGSTGAAIVAVPAHDTVKVVNADGAIVETLDRRTIWLAQTPQAFRTSLLRRAYEHAQRDGYTATDDAMLVERIGATVRVVPGLSVNRKITTPDDLDWAEFLLQTQKLAD
ncbi:MAG TPA: 2-C-methyl-D-erythritol 4-phosphate cytidylyltransferase [Candidatus Binatia bacterium]